MKKEVPEAWEKARERRDAALARYEAGGISYRVLGIEMGISAERARQLIAKASRERRQAEAKKELVS